MTPVYCLSVEQSDIKNPPKQIRDPIRVFCFALIVNWGGGKSVKRLFKGASERHAGSKQSRTTDTVFYKDVQITCLQVCQRQVPLAFIIRSGDQTFSDQPYLVVSFLLHVDAVHRHHTVPGAQPRRFCGGSGLHFADELAALPFLAVQVKSIPAGPFAHDTEPRFPLAGHFLPPFKTLVLGKSDQMSVPSPPLPLSSGMGVKAADGEVSVTFYCSDRASQTHRNFRRWKTKMRIRKPNFSTMSASGTDAKCPPDRMSCAGLKRTDGNSKRDLWQWQTVTYSLRSITSHAAGPWVKSMGSLSYFCLPTITACMRAVHALTACAGCARCAQKHLPSLPCATSLVCVKRARRPERTRPCTTLPPAGRKKHCTKRVLAMTSRDKRVKLNENTFSEVDPFSR